MRTIAAMQMMKNSEPRENPPGWSKRIALFFNILLGIGMATVPLALVFWIYEKVKAGTLLGSLLGYY